MIDGACTEVICVDTPVRPFGDISPPGGDGGVDIDDVLCALAGFAEASNCPDADLIPCGGNGLIDIDDILGSLMAFAGVYLCPHPCPP